MKAGDYSFNWDAVYFSYFNTLGIVRGYLELIPADMEVIRDLARNPKKENLKISEAPG